MAFCRQLDALDFNWIFSNIDSIKLNESIFEKIYFVAFHFVISKNLVLMLQKITSDPAGYILGTPGLYE